ncbi:MAG: right-handed parallel beta-helix repeat-containing protein [Methanoregula sp.]|nr:right-handed parallel beta-helix repeat-containing protein [Methanoregula sp.]
MKTPGMLLVLAVFVLILCAGCSGPVRPVPSSDSPGTNPLNTVPVSGQTTISSPGLYYLTGDLQPAVMNGTTPASSLSPGGTTSGSYIVIRSSDVIFDGMGYTLDGKKLTPKFDYVYGISVSRPFGKMSAESVVVRNITLSNWSAGLFFHNVSGLHVENSRFYYNDFGVTFQTASDISLRGSVFFKNNKGGINGYDLENIEISDNNFTLNRGDALRLYGWQEVPMVFQLFGKYFYFSYFHTNQKTGSGNGYSISRNVFSGNNNGVFLANADDSVISQNIIRDSRDNGIQIRKADNVTISDNSITGSGRYGMSFVNSGPHVVKTNNTLFGNNENEKTTNYDESFALSVFLGIVLIILLKVSTGFLDILKKFIPSKTVKIVLEQYSHYEDLVRTAVRNSRLSPLFEGQAAITITGALFFGGAYAYAGQYQRTLPVFCSILVISGIVTVTPRVAQFIVARRAGLEAEYRMWWGGIVVILITLAAAIWLPFHSIFGQPVRMEIQKEADSMKRGVMLTKIAGPLILVVLSVIFFALISVQGFVGEMAVVGRNMCLLTAVVFLLPVSPMEGEYLWKNNKVAWLLLFIPVILCYLYLITMT